MDDLPMELLAPVFRYLWFDDLTSVACVSKKLHATSVGDGRLMTALLCSVLGRADQQCCDVGTKRLSAAAILRMAYRVAASWPTRVDLDAAFVHFNAPPGLRKMNPDSAHHHIVAYQGTRLGNNRTIVANNHFPVVPRLSDDASLVSSSTLVRRSTLPFTKVVSFAESPGRCVAVSSTVAYYEITIGAPVPPLHESREPAVINQHINNGSGGGDSIQPCVAIGLALPGFSLRRMPGWCLLSYGWHGDDGHFFDGEPDHGQTFLTDNLPAGYCAGGTRFGAGDIVGCGIMYVTNGRIDPRLFFTKNGHLIGVDIVGAPRLRAHIAQPLFPAVGTDCYCPIDFNFGCDGRPFAFDVTRFEAELPDTYLPLTTPHTVRDGNWVLGVCMRADDEAGDVVMWKYAELYPEYRLVGKDGQPVAESAAPSSRPPIRQLLQEQPLKLRTTSHPLVMDAYAGALRSIRERRSLRSSASSSPSSSSAPRTVTTHPITGDAPSLFLDEVVIEEVRRMTEGYFDDDDDDDDASYGDSDDEFDFFEDDGSEDDALADGDLDGEEEDDAVSEQDVTT